MKKLSTLKLVETIYSDNNKNKQRFNEIYKLFLLVTLHLPRLFTMIYHFFCAHGFSKLHFLVLLFFFAEALRPSSRLIEFWYGFIKEATDKKHHC